MTPLPPEIPNVRVPAHGQHGAVEGYQDRDNFIRNLFTLLGGEAWGGDILAGVPAPSGPLSPSVKNAKQIVTLDQIKLHLHIEPDQTAEDSELVLLEYAAHIHTANVLRRDLDASAPENVKVAILLLIAHWYRNRESVGMDSLVCLPLAYEALLAPERNYQGVY